MTKDYLRSSLALGQHGMRLAPDAPKRPPLVVNVCHWCGAMWATYAGSLPRGWVKNTAGHLCCKRCRP